MLMRVWKLEASRSEEKQHSKWGWALALSGEEALELCKNTSGLPFNWVHEKHTDMLWPGVPAKQVDWS